MDDFEHELIKLALTTQKRFSGSSVTTSYDEKKFACSLLGLCDDEVQSIFKRSSDAPICESVCIYLFNMHDDLDRHPLHAINQAFVDTDLAGCMIERDQLQNHPFTKYHDDDREKFELLETSTRKQIFEKISHTCVLDVDSIGLYYVGYHHMCHLRTYKRLNDRMYSILTKWHDEKTTCDQTWNTLACVLMDHRYKKIVKDIDTYYLSSHQSGSSRTITSTEVKVNSKTNEMKFERWLRLRLMLKIVLKNNLADLLFDRFQFGYKCLPEDQTRLNEALKENKTKLTIIEPRDWLVLLPRSGKTDYREFSTDLIITLIKQLTALKPLCGWEMKINKNDKSIAASVLEFELFSAQLKETNLFMEEAEYKVLYEKISDISYGLCGRDIDDFKYSKEILSDLYSCKLEERLEEILDIIQESTKDLLTTRKVDINAWYETKKVFSIYSLKVVGNILAKLLKSKFRSALNQMDDMIEDIDVETVNSFSTKTTQEITQIQQKVEQIRKEIKLLKSENLPIEESNVYLELTGCNDLIKEQDELSLDLSIEEEVEHFMDGEANEPSISNDERVKTTPTEQKPKLLIKPAIPLKPTIPPKPKTLLEKRLSSNAELAPRTEDLQNKEASQSSKLESIQCFRPSPESVEIHMLGGNPPFTVEQTLVHSFDGSHSIGTKRLRICNEYSVAIYMEVAACYHYQVTCSEGDKKEMEFPFRFNNENSTDEIIINGKTYNRKDILKLPNDELDNLMKFAAKDLCLIFEDEGIFDAVFWGDLDIIKSLIFHGYNIHNVNSSNENIVHYCVFSSEDYLSYILPYLSSKDINMRNHQYGNAPVVVASRGSHIECIKLLVNRIDNVEDLNKAIKEACAVKKDKIFKNYITYNQTKREIIRILKDQIRVLEGGYY